MHVIIQRCWAVFLIQKKKRFLRFWKKESYFHGKSRLSIVDENFINKQ